MSTSEQAMVDRLKQVFVDPKLQGRMVDYVVRNKPLGWSRKSSAPYYKERYALELKGVLDEMMVDRQPRCYSYHDFLEQHGISKETLYLRVNQSERYLRDCLDPDRVYAKFLEQVSITRKRGVGVMLELLPEFRNSSSSDFVPRIVETQEEIPKWKQKMDEFLEDGEIGGSLHIQNLALSPDEISEVKLTLAGLKNIMSNITAHDIKLVKINYDA